MLRQKAVISCVGLEQREAVVIRSIFRLANWLQDEFEIPQPDEPREPDVLLVNADNPHAMLRWKIASSANKRLISVMLSSNGVQIENTIPLKRPLTLHKLVDVFKSICSTELHAEKPKSAPARSATGAKTAVPGGPAASDVLVVDDSLPVRKYMEYKLTQLAHGPLRIDFAANGMEAMSKIMRKSYQLVFLDVVMPGVDGYKVCKWIKNNSPTKVVLLTSRKSPFDKVRGAMSGCDNYLVKPPRDESVEKILATHLNRNKQVMLEK